MQIQRRAALLFTMILIAFSYGWFYLSRGNELAQNLGAVFLPLAAGAVSFLWLRRAYGKQPEQDKKFGRLLKLGVFLYFLANFSHFPLLFGKAGLPHLSHWLWLSSYAAFIWALAYQLRILSKSNRTFYFNILIFMITAVSLSFYYLVSPLFSDGAIEGILYSLSYPVADLLTVFFALNIYSLSRNTGKRQTLLFITVAFIIQIAADSIYADLRTQDLYQPGSYLDPLWMLSILLLGQSGFYIKSQAGRQRRFDGKKDDGFLLNGSVLVLLAVLYLENDWEMNVLFFGFALSLVLLLVRQDFIASKVQQLLKKLWSQAYSDSLTELPNRACFHEEIDGILSDAPAGGKVGLMLVDLDHFKYVNDTLGHLVGDRLLQKSAGLLSKLADSSGRVYRLGGDEFAIILPGIDKAGATSMADRILTIFQRTKFLKEYDFTLSPSIGVCFYPEHAIDGESLLKCAGMTTEHAKSTGRGNCKLYDAHLHELVLRKNKLDSEIRKALRLNQFMVYYQPKVELESRRIIGMEALLRWEHPELGMISPAEFIPIAEETGEIIHIGAWVLRTACFQTNHWHRKGMRNLKVSVNVSVRQLQHPGFIDVVKDCLLESELDPSCLELEITESIKQDMIDSDRFLKEIRAIGIHVSIDDFGTGYSSLSVLKQLPVDTLKIDRSFVWDITSDTSFSIIKTIIDIGSRLKLTIVVEGIEKEDQAVMLAGYQHGLIGQGYLFGRPMPADQFEKLLG